MTDENLRLTVAFGHHVVTAVLKRAEPKRGETTKNTKLQSDNNRERAEGVRHCEGGDGEGGCIILVLTRKMSVNQTIPIT